MLKILGRFFQSRIFIIMLLLLLQLFIIVLALLRASEFMPFLIPASYIFSFLMVLYILSRDMHSAYKLAWIVPILLMPIFGGLFYFLFGMHGFRRRRLIKRFKPYEEIKAKEVCDDEALQELRALDGDAALQSFFISNTVKDSLYHKTQTQYFPTGEAWYASFMEDIKQAKHSIFIEFFIIEEGVMLNPLLDLLELKAKEGLDVRLLYDDLGSAFRVARNFPAQMEARGIKCSPFNARGLKLSFVLNNRDHRKIVVIDSKISYTGGCNIADEYINAKQRFGVWKDTMVRLDGEASKSFSILFLEMWSFARGEIEPNIERLTPDSSYYEDCENDGFVQPFGDASPLNRLQTGKDVYLNAIQDARSSIYITTPYLIMDQETLSTLRIAAQMGLDVRIITPGIPDKRFVYEVTRANYTELLRAGVKIYEFSAGFIHAKSLVADDKIAIVSTVNFDYRSFYLHFENGVWMYKSKAVHQCHQDILDTCEVSREVSLEEQEQVSMPVRIARAVLSAFAPLL
ncbi:MAG: cardiolipin synthase [Coriobacteriia bacterium]|nr:cardiolipin synthase [Coriobacteriia bacterium]